MFWMIYFNFIDVVCWQRITEMAGVVVSFDPKPILVSFRFVSFMIFAVIFVYRRLSYIIQDFLIYRRLSYITWSMYQVLSNFDAILNRVIGMVLELTPTIGNVSDLYI